MPRIPVILGALCLMALVAGVGGYFLLRPPEPERRGPRHGEPPVNPVPPESDPNAAPKTEQPKLVVLVVFDQMRGDYMSRWAEHYGPDGFERLKKDGIWFSECHIPYACTSTGPGHASLATGAPPRDHGIIENIWFDRASNAPMYCCQPKRAYELIPPVASDIKELNRGSPLGYSPERLLAQTVGDALQDETKGKGRVFSLSIKDRTAVLMGGQNPTGAYCFDTRDGKFHTSAFYGRDAEHAWVKEFNDSKLADTWFDTKWERLLPEAAYVKAVGPDDAPGEADGFNGQGHTFPHSLKGKLEKPAKKYYDALEGSPYGNELLAALAKKAITAEKLGQGEVPDLLCVSFSSNDLLGHRWGPDSHEMMDATVRADRMMGAFLTFLDEKVGKGKYVVVLAADHGTCPLPEAKKHPTAQRVLITERNELAAGLDAALTAMYGTNPGDPPTRWLRAFDPDVWPWVYLNHEAIEARRLKVDDVASAARDWLAGRPYMDSAYTRKELEDGQFPEDKPFKKMAALAYRADRCGDVIVIPKAGVLVTPYAGGTSHGSPHAYDAHVPFLVYGAGVPALGKRAEKVSSLQVAPTLTWALGVPAPKQAALQSPAALPVKK